MILLSVQERKRRKEMIEGRLLVLRQGKVSQRDVFYYHDDGYG
jgi:hypothetical protein